MGTHGYRLIYTKQKKKHIVDGANSKVAALDTPSVHGVE